MSSISPSRAEIQRRIAEGNKRRIEEQRKQREYDEREREEKQELDQAKRGDVSTYISNIIISLLFISMPLTEPVVDWVQVIAYALANIIWNVFFHRHDWAYYALFIVINLLLVIWTPHIHALPGLLASISPMAYGIFFSVNSVVGGCLYLMWIDKAPSKRVRDERLDYSLTGMILANFAGMIVTGAIQLEVLQDTVRGLMYVVVNLSK